MRDKEDEGRKSGKGGGKEGGREGGRRKEGGEGMKKKRKKAECMKMERGERKCHNEIMVINWEDGNAGNQHMSLVDAFQRTRQTQHTNKVPSQRTHNTTIRPQWKKVHSAVVEPCHVASRSHEMPHYSFHCPLEKSEALEAIPKCHWAQL